MIPAFCRSYHLALGITLIASLVLFALFGMYGVSKEQLDVVLELDLAKPSSAHWLGNGENGIDVFAWMAYGIHTSLLIAIATTGISLCIGVIYGTCAGFFGGKIDHFLMRITDIFLAFPGILLALYLGTLLQPGLSTLILILSLTSWMGYARLSRAKTLEIKQQDFVLAAHALGIQPWRLLWIHLFPNMLTPILIQISFSLSGLLLAESTLSFLGVGLPLGTPSLGALLDQGVANLLIAPHLAIFPGICIALASLGFQLIGEGLRDWLHE